MSFLSFKLSDDFVKSYEKRKVNWGLIDAGGTSFSEVVFLRTYSRLKEDGTKETWQDVCRRVIEGTYSIQKDWAKSHHLPWNDHKAQRSAEEMFERMFQFKWTPPGRGQATMGTPMVNELGFSTSLQNCFTGNEKFLSRRRGIISFVEADEIESVWTGSEWTYAEIKSFGVQTVQRMVFAPAFRRNGAWVQANSNHRVTVVATPNHRWELIDGTLTTSIQPGAVVPARAATTTHANNEAYRHGLIFADGSINYRYVNGDYSNMMRLCGDKRKCAPMFSTVHYQPNCNGDPVVYHRSAENYKELPVGKDSDYLAAFIAAWIRMDGYTDYRNGNYKLTTQDGNAAEWLLENAAVAGYVVTGHGIENNETNYGFRAAPLHRITLARPDSGKIAWKLIDVELLPEQEEVFCAVVPEVERFTLSSGIYTSNCGAVALGQLRKNDPGEPFAWLMSASMLGVGIGYSTIGVEKLGITVREPNAVSFYTVPDSREGWAESTRLLINAYLSGGPEIEFDYSEIRGKGELIRSFGTPAPGPGPLMKLHDRLRWVFAQRMGEKIDALMIVDIANLIGKCVVSGNTRRSALLAYADPTEEFITLKDWTKGHRRTQEDGWAGASNNSIRANADSDLSGIIESIQLNGEPGIIWEDVVKSHGRLIDPPDDRDARFVSFNPCAEQPLENREFCTLADVYVNNHTDIEDFKRTLKFAFLYTKTVTLLPTHFEESNAVMQRNRRIGLSLSGVTDFTDERLNGLQQIRRWFDEGYDTVSYYDKTYSEWLCVRESNRKTTIKPGGTTGVEAATSSGIHWTDGGPHYMRALRIGADDPIVPYARMCGYTVEPDLQNPDTTVVIYFPIKSRSKRSARQVSLFEKAALAVEAQRLWSDNGVSVTLTFNADEVDDVATVLNMYAGQLKAVSFLPTGDAVYPQQPYTEIDENEYDSWSDRLMPIPMTELYQHWTGGDIVLEGGCTTDVCDLKDETRGN